MKKMDVNFIQHLKGFYDKASADESLSSTQIAIYMALFLLWNQYRFKNPLSIAKSEVMRLSKIGGEKTYYNGLKKLNDRGYLRYIPSKNPLIGSLIYLIRFDISREDESQIMNTSNESVVEPLINNINTLNNKKSVSSITDFSAPTLEEVIAYFKEKGYTTELATKAFDYYSVGNWADRNGKPVKNWKQQMQGWFKPENKSSTSATPAQNILGISKSIKIK